jgi:hypothetical protein
VITDVLIVVGYVTLIVGVLLLAGLGAAFVVGGTLMLAYGLFAAGLEALGRKEE